MKSCRTYLLPSALIPGAAVGMTAWILRHLGFLIGLFIQADEGDKFDFAEIFSQTMDASLSLHLWIPLLCGGLFFGICLGIAALIQQKGARIALCVIAGILLFLLSLTACLALTRVNDIRFCHLPGKLIPLMDKL